MRKVINLGFDLDHKKGLWLKKDNENHFLFTSKKCRANIEICTYYVTLCYYLFEIADLATKKHKEPEYHSSIKNLPAFTLLRLLGNSCTVGTFLFQV